MEASTSQNRPRKVPRKPTRKPRVTVRVALERRMVCAFNKQLKALGEQKRRHWTRVMGFSIAELQARLESQFSEGMSWEKFIAGEIDIDHRKPKAWFKYTSTADPAFRECWSLENLQPLWMRDNRSKQDRNEKAVGEFV